jgi:hypothetical protein
VRETLVQQVGQPLDRLRGISYRFLLEVVDDPAGVASA